MLDCWLLQRQFEADTSVVSPPSISSHVFGVGDRRVSERSKSGNNSVRLGDVLDSHETSAVLLFTSVDPGGS